MGKIVASIRTSPHSQDLRNQRLEILEFAREKKLHIDEFVETSISSRKGSRERRIDELLEKLNPGDTLVVTELSRLGRSTAAVILLINKLIDYKVRVHILKQNLDLQQSNGR